MTDTPAEAFADFLAEQLSQRGYVVEQAEQPTDRNALMSAVIQRHGLHPDNDADVLSGIPDEDLDEAAESLALLLKDEAKQDLYADFQAAILGRL